MSAVPAADPRTVAGDLDSSARAPTDGRARAAHGNDARADPAWVRWTIIGIAVGFLGVFIVLPLVTVFAQALSKGIGAYWAALADADTLHAVYLTLVTAVISVALNLAFGVVAAWAITKFEFRGKSFLIALIDLPFSVSPVIAGLVFVLLFGLQGVFGPWLAAHDVKIIFALPGIVLVTVFVTFPFVVRELIPLMQEQGTEEEEAALSLGASGLRTFIRVTLPNVKWALLYGVLLCNARAMGEFGAVSVVSGHIRGMNHAAAHRSTLRRLSIRRRVRGGVALGAPCHRHAGRQGRPRIPRHQELTL